MLTETQARAMLTLQSRMNARVNPKWVEAAYPYLRAVVVEGAEAMEHRGWKWWKQQSCDLEQLQMELVDIWHFILSHLLLEHDGDEEAALREVLDAGEADSVHFDGREIGFASLDLVGKLELCIGLAVARRVSLPLFAALLADCEMNWQDLYGQYVGKNVLNMFRQDHGYKEGSYRKLWGGREDNEHLVEILAELDAGSESYQHELYKSLKDRYDGLP
jgi:NTP pyrophosphatase (non-canonical NTP hydrolase)